MKPVSLRNLEDLLHKRGIEVCRETVLLRRFGFRRALIVKAVLSSVLIFPPATFTAQTPYLWMVAFLFPGGICRSLKFTAINATSYAEVADKGMSSASRFNAVLQQLPGLIGITITAFGLQAMQMILDGPEIDVGYFPAVSTLIAVLSLASTIWFARLSATSGSAVLTPVANDTQSRLRHGP